MPIRTPSALKARIKTLAADIDRWPSPGMIRVLIREANQAAATDSVLAEPLFEVGQAAAQFLKYGRDNLECTVRLVEAVDRLETVIWLRRERRKAH